MSCPPAATSSGSDGPRTTYGSTPPGSSCFHHPIVGDLDLPFESFPLAADPSQSLLTYTAEPGSPTQDALRLLASWAASTPRGTREASANNA